MTIYEFDANNFVKFVAEFTRNILNTSDPTNIVNCFISWSRLME